MRLLIYALPVLALVLLNWLGYKLFWGINTTADFWMLAWAVFSTFAAFCYGVSVSFYDSLAETVIDTCRHFEDSK